MRYCRVVSKEVIEHGLMAVLSDIQPCYVCNHPVYNRCSLYSFDGKGLAVIKQYFDYDSKKTWWADIMDSGLLMDIYYNPKFFEFFERYAKPKDKNGLYPTVTVRQIMWALRMKPLKKKRWETAFDHKDI